MRRVSSFVLAALVTALFACGTSNDACSPDAQRPCKCPDGTDGIQICQNNGTWGPCECRGQ